MSRPPISRSSLKPVAPGEEQAALGEGASAAAFDGRLIAWDPVNGSVRWSVEQPIAVNSSTLSTAGNLVFQGEGTGEFSAYAADSGKKLWSIKTGSAIDATPVSFSAGGSAVCFGSSGMGFGLANFRPGQHDGHSGVEARAFAAAGLSIGRKNSVSLPAERRFPVYPNRRSKPSARKWWRRERFFTRPTYAVDATLRVSTAAERGQ